MRDGPDPGADVLMIDVLERMDRALLRIAECLVDPEMTEDNIEGWQESLDTWWDKL